MIILSTVIAFNISKLSLNLLWKIRQSESAIEDIAFSPNNKLIASVGTDYVINIRNTQNGKLVATLGQPLQRDLSDEEEASIAWDPNGQFLASLYIDYQVKIWDLKTLRCVQILKCTSTSNHGAISLKFSNDGKLLVANNGHTIDVWNLQQKKLINTIKPIKPRIIIDFDFIDKNSIILAGEVPFNENVNIIEIYNLHNSKLIRLLKTNHYSDILSIIFSNYNNYLISGDANGMINVYLVPKWHLVKSFKINGGVTSIALSSQKILAIGTTGNKVILYNISNWKKVKEIKVKGDWTIVKCSPNGKLLAIGDSKGWVYLYRLNLR